MKREFVRTENAKRFRAAISMLEARGAQEAGWLLVTGRPGEGKTTTIYNWASEARAVMLTAQANWTVTRMLDELAAKLSIDGGRGHQAKIGEAIALDEIPIVVDEAQFALHDGAACLEVLRGITDKSKTPLVAITMESDVPKFNRRTQIGSRFFHQLDFRPSTEEDVIAACAQLAEVHIGDDLARRIHADTSARMRLVMNAIARVEQVARRMGKAQIGADDVKAMPLVEDFQRLGARKRGV